MEKSNDKYIYLALILVGVIATGVIASAFQEQETSLHLNSLHATIDANETEYTIIGSTDLNATVQLSSSELNLNNVSVDVDSNGNFKYKLTIHQNVTDVNVVVSAIATGKLEKHTTVQIDRPTNFLSLNNVDFTDNDTYVTVSGKTDPNAQITISSSDLDIEGISLVADSNGVFKYQLYVPKDKNDFKIKVESQILGKKVAIDTLSIVRIITPKVEPEPNAVKLIFLFSVKMVFSVICFSFSFKFSIRSYLD